MVSLKQLFEWFTTGKFPTEAQFAEQFKSFWHKSEKLPQTAILGLNEALEGLSIGMIYKPAVDTYNDTSNGKTSLLNEYPKPDKGWASLVKDENAIYVWDGLKWVNTGLSGFPSDVITLSDLTSEDTNFVFKIKDDNGKIAFAIYKNGEPYIPMLKDALFREIGMSELDSNLQNIFGTLDSRIFSVSSDKKYVLKIVDEKKRLAFGITNEGLTTVDERLQPEIDYLLRQLANVFTSLKELEKRTFKIGSDNKYALKISDASGKIPFGINTEGLTTIDERLQPQIDFLMRKLSDVSTGMINRTRDEIPKIPFPRSITRLDITSTATTLPAWETAKFYDNSGNYVEFVLERDVQGSSSLVYPKKNYKFDAYRMDGKTSLKMKFGDWIAIDTFHLKANWIDATHARNICLLRIFEQIYLSLPYNEQRPWRKYFDASSDEVKERLDTGAKGHIDGFGCEVFINGVYQGLYTWNLNKNRANYCLEKKNNNHICMEAVSVQDWAEFVPSEWEFRNPSGIDEGVAPPEPVYSTAKRLFDWIKEFDGLSQSAGQTKFDTEASNYIDLPYFRIYYLMALMAAANDVMLRNVLMTTWDGKVWYPMPYDWDTTIGLAWNGQNIWGSSSSFRGFGKIWDLLKIYDLPNVGILFNQYKDNILSTKNIENVFTEFSDSIGYEAYKRDYEKWTGIPSNKTTPKATISQIISWWDGRLPIIKDFLGV